MSIDSSLYIQCCTNTKSFQFFGKIYNQMTRNDLKAQDIHRIDELFLRLKCGEICVPLHTYWHDFTTFTGPRRFGMLKSTQRDVMNGSEIRPRMRNL